MDFRSQLSAFQNGGGSGGSGGNRGNGGSPHRNNNSRGYSSSNNSSNHSNNNNNQNRISPYGRTGGGGGGPGSGSDDRRRSRDWSPHHYQQGHGDGGPPPKSRRRVEDRDGLGDLRHHGYKIPRGLPNTPTPEELAKKPKHLALLVICIEDLPYEHIWREWLDTFHSEQDEYYVSVLCHAKFPEKVESKWLRQRLLVFPPKSGRGNSYLDPEFLTRRPDWGSVDLTRAMIDLLHTGLRIGHDKEKDPRFSSNRFLSRRPSKDVPVEGEDSAIIPEVDEFLYISETCLPVATAQEFLDVMESNVSWVNARHRKDPETPKNAYENDQFSLINRRIPGQYRWKADQWVLLCRKHASQIIGMDRPHIPHKYHLWQSYREINASDEMYIPTSLALLGFLRFTSQGEDTQRLRVSNPRMDEKGSKTDGKSTTTNPTPAPVDPATCFEFVKKRPVTYTDWTMGARNPATFDNGLSDFQKVARLARTKGCLVARKFAPYVAIPGRAKKDHVVTGQITASEWKEEMDKLAMEQPQTKDVVKLEKLSSKPVENKSQNEDEDAENAKDDDDEGEQESFLTVGTKTDTSAKKEENDDDDEENQLL